MPARPGSAPAQAALASRLLSGPHGFQTELGARPTAGGVEPGRDTQTDRQTDGGGGGGGGCPLQLNVQNNPRPRSLRVTDGCRPVARSTEKKSSSPKKPL